mgnify:CR=1 FL=1
MSQPTDSAGGIIDAPGARGGFHTSTRTPQQRPHASHHFARRKGLAHIIVSSGIEAQQAAQLVHTGGQHQNGHIAEGPDRPAHPHAVQARQHPVQDHGIGGLCRDLRHGGVTVVNVTLHNEDYIKGFDSFGEALRCGAEVFHTLKKGLSAAGHNTSVGDEGGFAPNLSSTRAALDFIMESIAKAGFQAGTEIKLALDCAATEFFKNGKYEISGEGLSLSPVEMADYLAARGRPATIDTVVAAMVDLQGRLIGKRFHAKFFVDGGYEETHGCNYLLGVDIEMEPVPGYKATSWEKGYGDFVLKPDMATLRRTPWLPGTALVLCDILDHRTHEDLPHSPRAMQASTLASASSMP